MSTRSLCNLSAFPYVSLTAKWDSSLPGAHGGHAQLAESRIRFHIRLEGGLPYLVLSSGQRAKSVGVGGICFHISGFG